MLPDLLLPLLATVIGGGGLFTAVVALRSDFRKAPIERSQAQIADAVAVSTAAAGLVETVSARMKAQDERAAKQDERAEAQDQHIRGLRKEVMDLSSKVDRIQYTWTNWYFELREDWEIHRTKDEAPPPPIVN